MTDVTRPYMKWLWFSLGFLVLASFISLSFVLLNQAKLAPKVQLEQTGLDLLVVGHLEQVSVEELKQNLQFVSGTALVDLDLAEIQARLHLLPWVRKAVVSRVFPRTLKVAIEEQKAVMKWNQQSYLNPWGEVFSPGRLKSLAHLTQLEGQDDGAKEMLTLYIAAKKSLSGKNRVLTKMSQNKVGVYRLHFKTGLEVVLGRKQLNKRLARLKRVFTVIAPYSNDAITYIDMRYRHGMAVKFNKTKRKANV